MKRKYQDYSTNFMEYRSQNFNQLSIIKNGITKEITMHAVLRIDRLFQQNNNNGTGQAKFAPTGCSNRIIKTEPGPV